MGRKVVFIALFSWFFDEDLFGQDRAAVDSLLTLLQSPKPDTTHVQHYLVLYVYYHRSNLDTALYYAKKAKALSGELEYTSGLVRSTYRLGTGYLNLRNFDIAKSELLESLHYAEQIGDNQGLSNAFSGLGKIYYARNEFDEAASAYLHALELLKKAKDLNSEARILNDLGNIYKMQRQHDKALTYYEDALVIVRKLNFQPGISSCLMNIGTIYIDKKEFQKAMPYLTETLAIKKQTGDKLGEGRCLLNMGSVYRELNDYSKAHDLYLQALVLAKTVDNPREINIIEYNLSLNEVKRGHLSEALQYGEASLKQSRLTNDLDMQIKSRGVLADTYAAMNQKDSAYEHERTIKALSDSLYNKNIIQISTELDAKYQRERKEKEIADLNSANQLNALQLQKRENERNYLIILSGFALLLGLVLWSRYRIKAKSNEKLKELDHAKSHFFANISHEFRTPLTLILGTVESLMERSQEQDDSRLTMLQRNAKRLQQLIEQLLDLSRLESNKLALSVVEVNAAPFLRAITSSFSSWAEQKQISLTIHLPDEEITAYFDQDIIEKIVANLLSNAIKFTPNEGAVSLSARWNANEMTVIVKNSGQEIPEPVLGKIFERFYQSETANTRQYEGSGIGLALVKELADLHRGTITVKSTHDDGTTFTVVIPIHRKYYVSSEIKSSNHELQKTVSRTDNLEHDPLPYPEDTDPGGSILIVEDNIDLAHFIADHLRQHHKILFAHNGTEGLAKAISNVPDLIISDVMMPEMDGVELCRKIKEEEQTSHIPLILLTAKADVESRLEGLETGADDYMTKPFDARELQMRVKNLISQREKLRARFSRIVMLKPKDVAITSPDERFLEKVMAITETHLSDPGFRMEDFQREIGMSRMQLHRKLKALTGHAAVEFIRIQRLIRASELLQKGYDNISDVCSLTGFNDLSYFSKCFKKQFGTTPKTYASKQANEV